MTPADMVADLCDAGMAYRHVARAIGVSHSTVRGWRWGQQPSAYALGRLTALHSHIAASVADRSAA